MLKLSYNDVRLFYTDNKMQFRLHWEDTTTATRKLHCVTLWIFMEYIGTLNFHEQRKLNVNETSIGPVRTGNLAVSYLVQVVLTLSEIIITTALDQITSFFKE